MEKKSLWKSLIPVTFILTFFAACGGGSGSTSSTGAVGEFFKYAPTPTDLGSPATKSDMWTAENSYAKWQSLYQQGDLTASGKITGISLRYGAAITSPITCPNLTIRMGHTNFTTFTNTFAGNVATGQGGVTTVLNNTMVTFPAGAAGTFQEITLTTPFHYNGVDNLVVEFERLSACSGTLHDAFPSVGYSGTLYSFSRDGSTPPSLVAAAETIKIRFNGGDDGVGYFGGSAESMPFAPPGYTPRIQMLHPANRINGSGPITAIGMVVGATTTAQSYTVTIRLGHTTRDDLTTNFANNYSGAPVTVADKLIFSVPAGVPAGTTLWLPVKGTFIYNGKDNLIVDIDVSATDGPTSWLNGFASSNAVRAVGTSGSTTAIYQDGVTYNTVFRFKGGQVTVLPPGTPNTSSQVLGAGTAGQIQSLYRNVFLGSSGTIRNVYVRLSPDFTPSFGMLSNYKIYIGHTTKTTYSTSDSYASNMAENALAMSGMVTIPSDLVSGDWVKIPLTTPFVYDSTRNLSILFTTDAGPSSNLVSIHSDGTLFPAHIVGRWNNSVTSSGTPEWSDNSIVDLKLDID